MVMRAGRPGKPGRPMAALVLAAGLSAFGKPNLVFIMADDVGYGDLSVYGATRVKTPNLDRLASEGMRFTNGHAAASTCSPSRYSLLTGLYPWRPPAKANGVMSPAAPMSIADSQLTLPGHLKAAGYRTGLVGKWHLGLGSGTLDFNREIRPGPLDRGFDYAFFIPTTNDRVPCVYVQDRKVWNLQPGDPITVGTQGSEPTGKTHPHLLVYPPAGDHDGTIVDSISRIGFMNGGKQARWEDDAMADTLVDRAVEFLEANRAHPFFLYFASQDVHVPRWPHARFRGKSGCGIRCDALVQLDWAAGALLDALDRLGLRDSTVVVFSSDNGGVLMDGYLDGSDTAAHGHRPNGDLRGGKYAIHEGGHRVPFIVRWPGKVAAGAVSGQLISQVDMLATAAALAGHPLPAGRPSDGRSLLPTWLSGGLQPSRDHLVVSDNNAAKKALISGDWKYISTGELYDLKSDPAEKTNVAAANPDRVKVLKDQLDRITTGPLPVVVKKARRVLATRGRLALPSESRLVSGRRSGHAIQRP